MPKKTPEKTVSWKLEKKYPVIVEFYDTVIKIRDEHGNEINVDKLKDTLKIELHGDFSFRDSKRTDRGIETS